MDTLSWKKIWQQILKWQTPIFIAGLALLYGFSRIFGLNSMPVFADESIYIRWAQLMNNDPTYTFFALNDGKPPLFIWILSAVLQLPGDPVWLSRMVSVVVGVFQILILDQIVRVLGGKSFARKASALIVLLAPFWFLHHRMALMDALLTLFLSVSFWGIVLIDQAVRKGTSLKSSTTLFAVALAGIGFGAALYTKTPALFFSTVFLAWAGIPWVFDPKRTVKILIQRTFLLGIAGFLGCLIFVTLRIHPAFGSLFSRSSDFTYTISEFFALKGQPLISNTDRILNWLSAYLRPELLSLAIFSIVLSHKKQRSFLLVLSALLFLAPFFILGKTLHARYLLPSALFLTAAAALMIEEAWETLQKKRSPEMMIVCCTLVGFFVVGSLRFQFFHQWTPDQTPFVLDDREQYLTEWSSGHGITQVRDLMAHQIQNGKRVTVVTEGSFGTLPDALLLYFDRMPEIQNAKIEGLGQYPVKYLPEWVYEEAKDHPTWLVVNSHRLAVDEATQKKLRLYAQYPRPYGAPELQVWEVLP